MGNKKKKQKGKKQVKQPVVPAKLSAADKKLQQTLSVKNQGVYLQMSRLFDSQKFKKSLRLCDQLLTKKPNHGEVLAMKGLNLVSLQKETLGVSFIKKGVAANFMSPVVWHIYGRYYKHKLMYEDAVKCYTRALKFNKGDLSIMRDMSFLQVHRGDYTGYSETRRKILVQKPNTRLNWVAYAVGSHMSGKYDKCLEILESYFNTKTDESMTQNYYEDSELQMYKATVLREKGVGAAEVLKFLESIEEESKDVNSNRELQAELHLELKQPKKAEALYRKLLDVNCENHAYYHGLYKTLGVDVDNLDQATPEQIAMLTALFVEFTAKYKSERCNATQRLPLVFLQGAAFKEAVDAYMRFKLAKGVPSLFVDLSSLYANQEKAKIIDGLVNGYVTSLVADLKFDPSDAESTQDPSILVWTYYLIASHYDFLGQHDKALQYIADSEAHTPTAVDTYMLKARILKHSGDHISAFNAMNQARELDLQDRYLNTKCCRYALRAHDFKSAETIVSLFLKDRPNNVMKMLEDMQCSWYEVTAGQAYLEEGLTQKALIELSHVVFHYDSFVEDQTNFHLYCLRKMTIRSYVKMLRWAKDVRKDKPMQEACVILVKAFLSRYATQQAEVAAVAAEEAKLDEAGVTALRKKREKETKKAEEAAAALYLKENKDSVDCKGDKKPDPMALDPLEQAAKNVQYLLQHSPHLLEGQLLAIKVYILQGKYLLAMRSLLKMKKLDASSPFTYTASMILAQELKQADQSAVNETTVKVLTGLKDQHLPATLLGADHTAYLNTAGSAAEYKNFLPRYVAVAEGYVHAGDSKAATSTLLASGWFSADNANTGVSLLDLQAAFAVLKQTASDAEVESARVAASKLFPRSNAFQTAEQVATLKSAYVGIIKVKTAEEEAAVVAADLADLEVN